jgi:glycosyltransferase involved in cell wall biosynthesis
MRIVIDARLYSQTGVGRYIRQLISHLAKIDRGNQYLIYLTSEDFSLFKPAPNFAKKLVNIRWHSLKEQLVLPLLLIKDRANLVHFPYFSVPIFYPGRFLVTIHDLTIDHFDTGQASTRHLLIYKLKRRAYRWIIRRALNRAQKVIAVSQTTKKEIIEHYQIKPQKIVVTYEAAELEKPLSKKTPPLIPPPYLLYVGNAYPHKNLTLFLKANLDTKIVLVGKKDFFYQRLEKELTSSQKEKIILFGQANDQQLSNLYQHALAFIFPSLMEGFGLPGLEAMACGLPVICSDIPVFREIYQEAALYFEPDNAGDLALKVGRLLKDKKLYQDLQKRGFQLVKKFSWHKMAQQTLKTYEDCLSL